MRLNRSENTKRNIIIGEIDKISGVLLPFIVRTMIIHLIGAEYLGLTGLFYSIMQMLNLAEMGFSTAIVYSMYQPIAENDTNIINALLRFYSKVYRIVGLVVAGVGITIMPFLQKFISGSIPSGISIYWLYLIYLANCCISFFVFPEKKALLNAFQRDDLSGRIHIVTQLAMYIGQAVAVLFTKNYYLYAVMMPITSFVYSIFCAKCAKKQYPKYVLEGDLPTEKYQKIKKQVAGLTIRKLAILSRNAMDSVFISAFLGLTMNAIYANYYYIMDSVVIILAVIKTSMAGGVGNSIAMESLEKNRRDMHRINFLFMWISGWCSICFLCLYQPFMKLWVGEEMTLSFGIAILFSVYFYVLKMADIRSLYSESAGIWWQARYISVAEVATNLSLNWVLVQVMGLYGIILATLVSYFFFNFLGGAIILFKYYFTEGGFGDYLLSHLKYVVVTSVIALLTYTVVSHIGIGGLVGFIMKGIICAILPNAMYLLIYFKTEDFKDSMPLIGSVLKIKW